VRVYQDKPIDRNTCDAIIRAAMRSPTAGNMMLYSIIEVTDQTIKDKLVISCDNQPFIARASLVLVFLADYQRWFDLFMVSDVETYCKTHDKDLRYPGEGDLMLACCDALIAAQTAVIAAEALGVTSCYIGDIMENYEFHRDLFNLPQYTFPITMLCFGYPKPGFDQKERTPRFAQEYIHFKNQYQPLNTEQLLDMSTDRDTGRYQFGAENFGQQFYARKFASDFSVEMTRSVRAALDDWVEPKSPE
jgi:FMN reductase (NADPH)/FMN reductase [NAD(P)H]